jgi:hypothetical protein
MTDDSIPTWLGDRRIDGALVVVTQEANWIVLVEGKPALTQCPCCSRLMHSASAAKRVCDAVYPLDPDAL